VSFRDIVNTAASLALPKMAEWKKRKAEELVNRAINNGKELIIDAEEIRKEFWSSASRRIWLSGSGSAPSLYAGAWHAP